MIFTLGVRDQSQEVDDMRRKDDLLGSVFVSGCFQQESAVGVLLRKRPDFAVDFDFDLI